MEDSTKRLISVIVLSVSIVLSVFIYTYKTRVKVYYDKRYVVFVNTWTGEIKKVDAFKIK